MLRSALSPTFTEKMGAISRARAIGGAISLPELEALWVSAAKCRKALCIAEEPERCQVEVLIRSRKGRAYIAWYDLHTKKLNGASSERGTNDLVVIGRGCEPDPRFAETLQSGTVIRISSSTPPSRWGYRANLGGKPACSRQGGAPSEGLPGKLERGEAINVLLLNDIGFQCGAGGSAAADVLVPAEPLECSSGRLDTRKRDPAERVVAKFTLAEQARAWADYLKRFVSRPLSPAD
jgi:hypothetical protein